MHSDNYFMLKFTSANERNALHDIMNINEYSNSLYNTCCTRHHVVESKQHQNKFRQSLPLSN